MEPRHGPKHLTRDMDPSHGPELGYKKKVKRNDLSERNASESRNILGFNACLKPVVFTTQLASTLRPSIEMSKRPPAIAISAHRLIQPRHVCFTDVFACFQEGIRKVASRNARVDSIDASTTDSETSRGGVTTESEVDQGAHIT